MNGWLATTDKSLGSTRWLLLDGFIYNPEPVAGTVVAKSTEITPHEEVGFVQVNVKVI